MSFKSLIQSLYKLSGSQAMPSESNIDLGSLPTSGTWSETYTAVSDGYFVLFGVYFTAVEISNITKHIRAKSSSSISAGIFVPVSKGDQVNFYCEYTGTGSLLFKLVKTIGAS